MDRTKHELASIIRDLVRIAKVAMPPDLFMRDPRVMKANAYLVALGDPSHGRPPNTGLDALATLLPELVDLRPIDGSKMILDWDLVDPLIAAREQGMISVDDGEALNAIVRDWLIAHGYLPAPPDQDN